MCDLLLTVLAVLLGFVGAAMYVRHHERRYTVMREHQARGLFAPDKAPER
jgi:hypothetical protein